jgi:hypothetical protein
MDVLNGKGVGRIGWVGLFWDVRAAEAMTKCAIQVFF